MKVSKSIAITINSEQEVQLLSNVAELARRYIQNSAFKGSGGKMVDEYEVGPTDMFIQEIFDATS